MSTATAGNKTALDTIELLQYRLQRVEHYLTGSDDCQEQLQKVAAQGRDHGVIARLAQVEDKLSRLAAKLPFVHDLLSLCMLGARVVRCID